MILLLAALGCGPEEPAEPTPPPGVWTDRERDVLEAMRLTRELKPDPTNRVADDPDAARLGRMLFFDAGLSPSGKVACATCHQSGRHFTDGTPLGKGLGETGRHTPGIVGSQLGPFFFWDGRADSLWAQAAGPMENPDEMGGDRVFVARYVLSHDRDEYEKIFGPAPDLSDPARFPAHAAPEVSPELDAAWRAMAAEDREMVNRVFTNVAKAIAAYERLLLPEDAPFDRYVDAVIDGDPAGGGHLDEAQVRGLAFFLRDGNCTSCHHGPMLTDRAFHNLGVPEPVKGYDAGRQTGAALVLASDLSCRGPYSDTQDCPELKYLNPQFPDFQAAFKTPSLRYVAETAPYMHNGSMATLEEVLTFYSDLPGNPPAGHRELTLKPLEMTDAEKADVIVFLRSLTGDPLPAELMGPPKD